MKSGGWLVILSGFFCICSASGLDAQTRDTLAEASVISGKNLPVVKPSEEVSLSETTAPSALVSDVVNRFTGVQVKDYGGVGGLKTINVRSLGSEHIGIFIDGIQVDNAQNMQVDLGRFSTDGFGGIALYNAQKASRLQTAKEYASGAALYLRTSRPRPESSSGFGGRLRLRGGSFGLFNPSARIEKSLGRVSFTASAEFLTNNGKYKYPYFDTTLVRRNGDITSLRLEAQIFGELKKGGWDLHLYRYASERGFPGPVIRRAAGFPFSAERQGDGDIFVQGGWTYDWSERYSTAIRFKYSNNYTHYNSHAEKNPMAMPYNLHYRQQSGYLSLAQSYIITASWSVDFSADIQRNILSSDVGQFVRPSRTSIFAALASRFALPKFRAAAHLLYLGASDKFDSPDAGGWSRSDAFRRALMPSLTLFYSPADFMEAGAYIRRSYRLPSFNDLYYTLIGNSGLDPESAFQTGLDFRLRSSGKPSVVSPDSGALLWSLRLSPYYNRVSDKIVAIPTSSQFRWTMLNIGKVDVFGLDFKAECSKAFGWGRLGLVLRYSLQKALDHSVKGSQTYGNQIPYIPVHSGGIDFSADFGSWSFSWSASLSGERWSRSANISDYRIAPWMLSDLSLGRKFLFGSNSGTELHINLFINNVFDRAYQIVQGYPMPGRNLRLGLELNF